MGYPKLLEQLRIVVHGRDKFAVRQHLAIVYKFEARVICHHV